MVCSCATFCFGERMVCICTNLSIFNGLYLHKLFPTPPIPKKPQSLLSPEPKSIGLNMYFTNCRVWFSATRCWETSKNKNNNCQGKYFETTDWIQYVVDCLLSMPQGLEFWPPYFHGRLTIEFFHLRAHTGLASEQSPSKSGGGEARRHKSVRLGWGTLGQAGWVVRWGPGVRGEWSQPSGHLGHRPSASHQGEIWAAAGWES